MAGPLRGGRGKGPAIKEKLFFLLRILLPFTNKHYFTLNDLSKYGHITLKFVGRYFYWVVKKTKTNPTAIKPEEGGGGKALMAWPLRK